VAAAEDATTGTVVLEHGQTIFVDGGMTLYPEFVNGGSA
jgi:hypothetical protein